MVVWPEGESKCFQIGRGVGVEPGASGWVAGEEVVSFLSDDGGVAEEDEIHGGRGLARNRGEVAVRALEPSAEFGRIAAAPMDEQGDFLKRLEFILNSRAGGILADGLLGNPAYLGCQVAAGNTQQIHKMRGVEAAGCRVAQASAEVQRIERGFVGGGGRVLCQRLEEFGDPRNQVADMEIISILHQNFNMIAGEH